MNRWLITNARMVNEGRVIETDLRIHKGRIDRIDPGLTSRPRETLIDADGRYLLPGIIDSRVHFREPGQTRKGNIATESRAAVAGGVTSYVDMPDTSPPTTTRHALADKFSRAAGRSTANYSFCLGASNDNLDEIRATGVKEAFAVSVCHGDPDSHLPLDRPEALVSVFEHSPLIVMARCEHGPTVQAELAAARARYGNDLPAHAHSEIHSSPACVKAAGMAVELAREHGTELVLQVSSADEVASLEAGPLAGKRITALAGMAHLYFIDEDYGELGHQLKCSPAIRSADDRKALRQALRDNRLDLLATDHAPHLLSEKTRSYHSAASGLPLVQQALPMAWSLVAARILSPEQLVEKLSHNPAIRFGIERRGFLREGYWADLAMVDQERRCVVDTQPVLSQCGWTPLAGRRLPASVAATWVNGYLVWRDGLLTGIAPGQKLEFSRDE
jgi:dihydroorotase